MVSVRRPVQRDIALNDSTEGTDAIASEDDHRRRWDGTLRYDGLRGELLCRRVASFSRDWQLAVVGLQQGVG